jgi:hypothetical protein
VDKQTDDNQITQYLLGALPAAEAEQLDEISITDDQFALRLQSVENDLVDAYVHGELRGETLARFRSVYLKSPAAREKVQFAERFLKLADVAPPVEAAAQVQPKTGRWSSMLFRLSAAAALVLIIIGWLFVQDLRLREQRDQATAEREAADRHVAELQTQLGQRQAAATEQQNQIDELRNAIARLESPALRQEPSIVPFALEPQTRGIGRISSVSVPAGTDFVTFQLDLETDSPGFQATLKSIPGDSVIWSRAALRPQSAANGRVLIVTVRAALLNSGDYVWELSRPAAGQPAEAAGNYVFRVLKR